MSTSSRAPFDAALSTRPNALPDAWAETSAQTALATQLLRNKDEYLASPRTDIGRHTGLNEHELFVSCDPAEAMLQQFEHLRPDCIAVHDVATRSSRRLLAGVAAASGVAVQKLVIRRQGYGTPLATLEFIEMAAAEGPGLRVYSTEVDADAAYQPALARMLLAFSRLGVVMLGDVPAHVVSVALKPLHADMLAGPWPNRQLLLLPLAAPGAWVAQGTELTRGTGVNVRTAPQVTRPADAWGFVSSTWARLRENELAAGNLVPALADIATAGSTTAPPAPAATSPAAPSARLAGASPRTEPQTSFNADTEPMPMRPMPKVPTAAERAQESVDVFERYVQRLAELPGMVSCCVFDVSSGRALAHAGASPGADELALHGSELLQSISTTSRMLSFGHALPEAAITLGRHHLLLRPVPGHARVALHAVLDKSHANLTLARLQVQRMDDLFN